MKIKYCLGVALIACAFDASAAEYEIAQRNKAFAPVYLKIKVGDVVNFVNDDPFAHNVYSLSETKSFDVGSYPKGQGKQITFDKPGQVFVECAIHPFMKMKIEVTQ